MAEDSGPTREILEARVVRDGETATLALAGEFDLASVDLVREKLAEARSDSASRVVIDLRELTFIDSTGIWFLLSTVKEDADGMVSFVPSDAPAVQRVLSVTGVAEMFGGEGDGSRAPDGA